MQHLVIAFILAFVTLAGAQESSKGELKVRFLSELSSDNYKFRAPACGNRPGHAGGGKNPQRALRLADQPPVASSPARLFSVWSVAQNVAVAAVTLPEHGQAFIILLIPSPNSGYDPVVIPADDPAFKPGDVYFYNHADKPVLGYVGSAKFLIAPAHGQILRPAGATAEKFYNVGIGVRENDGDRVLSTTRWPENQQMRTYVFFFISPKTNRLDFRAVDEFVPVVKPSN